MRGRTGDWEGGLCAPAPAPADRGGRGDKGTIQLTQHADSDFSGQNWTLDN